MSGKASRDKGHAYERQIMNELKDMGYDCLTARNESKRLDDAGVDLVDDTPFYFQLKAVERLKPSFHEILKGMPTEKIPVVLNKRNNKGTVVAMKWEDFKKLLL